MARLMSRMKEVAFMPNEISSGWRALTSRATAVRALAMAWSTSIEWRYLALGERWGGGGVGAAASWAGGGAGGRGAFGRKKMFSSSGRVGQRANNEVRRNPNIANNIIGGAPVRRQHM